MRNIKIIVLLITISMLLTCAAAPVSAAETVFTKTYASDNFADGTDGWIVGESGEGRAASMTVVDDSGAEDGKALKITFPAVGAKHEKGDKYAVYGSVTKQGIGNGTEFSTDKELTIKLRVKKTDSAMSFEFKGNRPNTIEQVGHDFEWTHYYSILHQNAADGGIAVPSDYATAGTGNYGGSFYGYRGRPVAASTKVDLTGKWVTYTIKFKPADSKYYITTTYTDTNGTEQLLLANQEGYMRAAKPELLKEYGDDFAYDPNIRQYFSGLKSVTFTSRTAGDIYVDYVEIYGERDIVTTSATLDENYIRTTDALKLTFTAAADIAAIPEGAVYIDGVDADVTYDKATKTVTLQPKSELIPGAHHTVKVNSDLLYEDSGIIFEGETDFAFDVSDVSVSTLVASGRVIPGTVITSSYIYSSSKPEGTHQYQWQMSENGIDGWQDIIGATSKDFIVTDNEYGKYIRFEMIPYGLDESGNNTYYGFETYSNAVIPEKAPVAENVILSSSTLFSGIYISALYDYIDENGDEEGETEVRWYTSDAAEGGEWTEVKIGKTYFIENTDAGKYIKCAVVPVADSQCEARGLTVESPVAGPVADILESTNMFEDSSFEAGRWLEPWTHSTASGWIGPDVHSKDAHTGTYSVHMPPRVNESDNFGQSISYTKGKSYVLGAWAKKSSPKAQDITGMSSYTGGSGQLQGAPSNTLYTLNNRWQHIVYAYTCLQNASLVTGFVTWEAIKTGDAYLDDYYCGELLVGDIHTYDVEPVTIPVSGKTKLAVTNGQALNQLGTNHGLENEKVIVSIPDTEGVYVDGGNIVITDKAHPTKLSAEIYCEPEYEGATQAKFQKFVEIEINAHNDPKPKALDVDASGTVSEGAVLTGTYSFYQVNDEADASTVRWMYSDSENGVYYDIPEANALTYTVEALYADKYIKMAVIPKSESGLVGDEVRSAPLTSAKAPFAKDVEIKGTVKIGAELTGEYTFVDPNRDAEGTSIYQWYIADEIYGPYTAIRGQNGKTLTVTGELKDKYIKFAVIPVSAIAPEVGEEAASEAVLGPVPPQVTEVSIKKDDYRLYGIYKYFHPNGIREGKSVYTWTIDGVTVSNASDYVIDFNGTKTVTFSVKPVCDSEPESGEMVSVSMTVTGHSASTGGNTAVGGVVGGFVSGGSSGGGGGSSSGGGLSGGSGTGTGITSVNDMKLEQEKSEASDVKEPSDIDGHWGEEYIGKMAELGVMEADESGNYQPDENVTRQSMLTFLFKALGLEESEYKNEFGDVADGEFAKMLQTMVDNGTIAKDDNFRPGDTITREEMCKILYISLKNTGKLEDPDEMLIEGFADFNTVSDWARIYVNAIYGNKIMVGVSDTEFDPLGTVTKAQAATMLTRILNVIEGEAE